MQQFFVDLVTSDDETSSPLSLYDSIEMSRKNKRKKSKKGKGKGENEEKEVKLLVTYLLRPRGHPRHLRIYSKNRKLK